MYFYRQIQIHVNDDGFAMINHVFSRTSICQNLSSDYKINFHYPRLSIKVKITSNIINDWADNNEIFYIIIYFDIASYWWYPELFLNQNMGLRFFSLGLLIFSVDIKTYPPPLHPFVNFPGSSRVLSICQKSSLVVINWGRRLKAFPSNAIFRMHNAQRISK